MGRGGDWVKTNKRGGLLGKIAGGCGVGYTNLKSGKWVGKNGHFHCVGREGPYQ